MRAAWGAFAILALAGALWPWFPRDPGPPPAEIVQDAAVGAAPIPADASTPDAESVEPGERRARPRLDPKAPSEPTTSGDGVRDDPLLPGEIALRGRAVSAAGQPLPGAALQLRGRTGVRDVFAAGRADDAGWFTLRLAPQHLGFALEHGVLHQLEAGQFVGLAGAVRFEKRLVSGAQDIGDVRIVRVPPVARGRFSGAVRTLHQVQLRLEFAGPDGQWRDALGVVVVPHIEDDFEVRALDGTGRYRLHVTANRCAPVAPIEFLAGAFELEVLLTESAGR